MVGQNQSKTPSRKEREREAHRRDILEAAEKVFISRGYDKATVEQIAMEADFSVGTLYNFFKNKEDLYITVLEKIAEEFRLDFDRMVKGEADPVLAIGNLIRLRLNHWDSHRGLFRVFTEKAPDSLVDPMPALPERLREVYRSYLTEVSEVFERGMRRKVLRKADPLYLTLCLEGIINATVAYWAEHEREDALVERIEKIREAFFRWLEAVAP